MCDSDDTDILLRIPANYFIDSAEQKLQQQKAQKILEQQESGIMNVSQGCSNNDACLMPPPATTAIYRFLPPDRKAELNQINSRLHNLENEDAEHNFAVPSDISTISTGTVHTPYYYQQEPRTSLGVTHSTPVKPKSHRSLRQQTNTASAVNNDELNNDLLLEIDNYLAVDQMNANKWQHHSDNFNLAQARATAGSDEEAQAHSLPNAFDQMRLNAVAPHSQQATANSNNNLISLSEIWGNNAVAATVTSANNSALKEEQLRRQHLEKTVHLLQSRLLEYQQRLSVAIEVDRSKDAALALAHAECQSLNAETKCLREAQQKQEIADKQQKQQMEFLQNELAQAVSLTTKFEEKNTKLENELAAHARNANARSEQLKQQLEELQLKLQSLEVSEQFATKELNKYKDGFTKMEYQKDKLALKCADLETECAKLKQQKETLHDFQQKQRTRADALETQRKCLQDKLDSLTENEATLRKKLELQQKNLKQNYQQQLEQMVTRKHAEFQTQLNQVHETIKTEARERERLIAERAVKQLELINEKTDLEFNLMQEKHNEEVALYRIQLANASKKIDDLELKLNCYKSKRADIAEKLHNVMETQWQKALEILTSPNQTHQTFCDTDADATMATTNNDSSTQNAHMCAYESAQAHHCCGENAKEHNHKQKHKDKSNKEQLTTPATMDRLQAYIELLLSKSPGDFEKLTEILALSNKSKLSPSKQPKSSKRYCSSKPPWKA